MSAGLIAGAAACAGEATVTTTPGSRAPIQEAAPAAQQPSPTPSLPATVGATIDLTGTGDGEKLAVTLVQVVDPARAQDEIATPAAGTRFVAVQFRLKNIGTVVYKDSPGNGAQVVDAQGQQFDTAFYSSNAGVSFPGSITVAPGDTGLGFLTFEVPKASKITKVQFSMNGGLAPDTGQWNVP
ncbi:DUF4352 domain-containing protein [Streptomyces sp. NPDC048270]|uniref:DUF4352 domain-containing protein n=1 Tax=Streptomyces sp. NPDC048270 TaxID=3154615 RepID=UPI0033FB5180